MHHEQEIQALEEKIRNLEAMLCDINSDFSKCARGTSACFFCACDQDCVDPDKYGCHFIWKAHN